jgi:lysophospholipase L1-like esterase
MAHSMRRGLILCWLMIFGLAQAFAGAAVVRADEQIREDPDWGDAMAAVHARFKGERGTFAHFGDSITVSMAFWSPLRDEPKDISTAAARSYRRVKDYMSADCWSNWKGPDFGNDDSTTIRWAHQNIDGWLKRRNPEVALIMFGTNDLRQVALEEYRKKTGEVVRRCLKNGTVVILNTIPPQSGFLKESRIYADAVAAIAREEQVPLVDYFGEVLRRRPDDWDGTLKKFASIGGDDYQVPTLIARDGVHPSNPQAYFARFSQDALNNSGYGLRNYLVLLEYSRVVERVLDPKAKAK